MRVYTLHTHTHTDTLDNIQVYPIYYVMFHVKWFSYATFVPEWPILTQKKKNNIEHNIQILCRYFQSNITKYK